MIIAKQLIPTPEAFDIVMATPFAKDLVIQSNQLAGWIVASIKDGTPVSYRDEYGLARRFDDNNAEEPKVYKTVKEAVRAAKKMNEDDMWIGYWQAEIWFHTEFGTPPLEKYVKMHGLQFPGSPRQ